MWLPWVDRTQSAEDVRQFIEEVVSPQWTDNRGPQCGIWVDGSLAGSVGCHAIDWTNRACSLGYWIESRRQGQGIVTRPVAGMLNYLFAEMLLHRVVIQCAVGNHRAAPFPSALASPRKACSARPGTLATAGSIWPPGASWKTNGPSGAAAYLSFFTRYPPTPQVGQALSPANRRLSNRSIPLPFSFPFSTPRNPGPARINTSSNGGTMSDLTAGGASQRRDPITLLHESEKVVMALLQSASQAILSIDRTGRIVLANPKTEEMFGRYTGEELLGAPN